jgi:hypothetical protein
MPKFSSKFERGKKNQSKSMIINTLSAKKTTGITPYSKSYQSKNDAKDSPAGGINSLPATAGQTCMTDPFAFHRGEKL